MFTSSVNAAAAFPLVESDDEVESSDLADLGEVWDRQPERSPANANDRGEWLFADTVAVTDLERRGVCLLLLRAPSARRDAQHGRLNFHKPRPLLLVRAVTQLARKAAHCTLQPLLVETVTALQVRLHQSQLDPVSHGLAEVFTLWRVAPKHWPPVVQVGGGLVGSDVGLIAHAFEDGDEHMSTRREGAAFTVA